MPPKTPRAALKVDDVDFAPSRPRLPMAPDDDDARILAGADALSARHGALRDGTATPVPVSVPVELPKLSDRASWKLVLPAYLDIAMGQSAASRQVTKNFLVLEALKAAGFEVRPEDLVGDRRRRQK